VMLHLSGTVYCNGVFLQLLGLESNSLLINIMYATNLLIIVCGSPISLCVCCVPHLIIILQQHLLKKSHVLLDIWVFTTNT